MTICDRCGRELEIGSYPFCPHGRYGQNARVTNEAFIGGQVIENLDDQPVTVYSREELKQEMEKRGLEQRIKHVPGDHYLIDWAAGIDAQTLDNARVLTFRTGSTHRSDAEDARRAAGRLESLRVGWQTPC